MGRKKKNNHKNGSPAPLVVLPSGASSEASCHVELGACLVASAPWGAFPWAGNAASPGVPSERQQQTKSEHEANNPPRPSKSTDNKEMLNAELEVMYFTLAFSSILPGSKQGNNK